MDTPKMPLAGCEICSRLQEKEYSYSKYGWPENDISFPAEVARLVPTEDLDTEAKQNHHQLRCPICGRLYQYDFSYEYLVNGSEDEGILQRLPDPPGKAS